MDSFHLDHQLENDCHILGSTSGCLLLLMDNSLVPWFILVPKTTVTELHELSEAQQIDLLSAINRISAYVMQTFTCEKLNVAAIGNKVSQLHVHVVGRKKSDFCWPEVVWGQTKRNGYSGTEVENIVSSLSAQLGSKFKSKVLL